MRQLNLDQGSPQWHEWRGKGLGASDAPVIMGVSPWTTPAALLVKKVQQCRGLKFHATGDRPKTGGVAAYAGNGALERGTRMEPIARKLYQDLTGIQADPICCIHDTLHWMKASLDGHDPVLKIVQEIKCPNADDHATAVSGHIPIKYFPQVQHQLVVTNYPMAHYISYTDNRRFASRQLLAVVEVPADPEYIVRLIEAEKEFWLRVLAQVSLPLT